LANLRDVIGTSNVKVTFTDEQNTIKSWFHAASLQDKTFGFDLEWSSSQSSSQYRKAALVQLSSRFECLLLPIQRIKADSFSLLQAFMSDPYFLKVGVAVHSDAARLEEDFQIMTRNCCDIGLLSWHCKELYGEQIDLPREPGQPRPLHYLQPKSLFTLCQDLLGYTLQDKGQSGKTKFQHNNWETKYLSFDKLRYAALDAVMSRAAYEVLSRTIDNNNFNEKVLNSAQVFLKSSTMRKIKKAFTLSSVKDDCFHLLLDKLHQGEYPFQYTASDSLSQLNEFVQAAGLSTPEFKFSSSVGEAEEFTVHIFFGTSIISEGQGTSKQLSKERAAKEALEKLTSSVRHPALLNIDKFLPSGRRGILPTTFQHSKLDICEKNESFESKSKF